VSPKKTGFRGAAAHYRAKGNERFKIFGVEIASEQAAEGGDELYADGKRIGVVTCGMTSTLTGKSLAIARLDVDKAIAGTPLELRGKSFTSAATARALPFDDPQKKKRTAVD
jgi:aminomethyltransferase